MNNDKVRKQHTVPTSYLERFCIEDKPNYIYCYDKIVDKEYCRNIKHIAFGFYFYDISAGDEQVIERQFSIKEGRWKTAINSLIEKGNPKKISFTQRKLIFEFVITQMIRTNERRINLMEVFNHLYPEENTNLSSEEYIKFVDDFKNKGIKISHKQMIDRVQKYISIISHYHMHLWINNTKIPLKTSDNPVTTYNKFKGKKGKVNGIANDDIEIFIPINYHTVNDVVSKDLLKRQTFQGKSVWSW